MAKENKQLVSVSTGEGGAKRSPLAAVARPFEEMERRFERLFHRPRMRGLPAERDLWGGLLGALPFEMRWPSVDVIDRENEVVVRAETPGVDKKDLEVSVSDNILTIKGQMRHEEKEERGEYFRSEISQGSFSRSVLLPVGVDAAKVNATLKDGILEITLPKLEGSKRRTIKVQ